MTIKTNIYVDQGTDYSWSFYVIDSNNDIVDLTNYTSAAQFRKHYSSNTYVAFNTTIAANSEMTVGLYANQTSNVVAGRFVYDINITSNTGIVTRVKEGVITITPRVTR